METVETSQSYIRKRRFGRQTKGAKDSCGSSYHNLSPCLTLAFPCLDSTTKETDVMTISKRKSILMTLALFTLIGVTQIVLESYADARAGGGRSGGSRGSRGYSSPSRPAQASPTQ